MITDVTAVILAGGKSSRMGRDKALLQYEGQSLIERVYEGLSAIFTSVALSVNTPKAYPSLKAPRVVDRYPEIGPLGGITSVLETGLQRIFCVACDMPHLDQGLIQFLCGFDLYDGVFPRWNGRIQTLHALYSGNLLSSFQSAIHAGRFKIIDILAGAKNIQFIDEAQLASFNPARAFQNINTPDEYDELRH